MFNVDRSIICIKLVEYFRFSLIDDQHNHPVLPMTFDMTAVEDVSLYSCTQYDFMKTADEILSSATFADCIIDPSRVTFHETILEGNIKIIISKLCIELVEQTSQQTSEHLIQGIT